MCGSDGKNADMRTAIAKEGGDRPMSVKVYQ